MPRSRALRIAVGLTRGLVYAVALLLLLIGLAFAAAETAWGKDRLRRLIIQQANLYLAGTLEIDRLEGSLVRGIELQNVRLSRDGRALLAVADVSLSYSLRELFETGVVVRRVRLTRPRITAGRQPDGRWDLAALIRREAREQQRRGPSRPITIQSIEVIDGIVDLRDPLRFGAANASTRYDSLNALLTFTYEPVSWRIRVERASWTGRAPDLTVSSLSGDISSGRDGLSFAGLRVQTPATVFTLAGRIVRDPQPTRVDLRVNAERFSFQEWAGVIRQLQNVAVEAAFDVSLKGPIAQLATGLTLESSAGGVRGALVLDTTAPGWRGAGAVELTHFNVARWFSWPDRPSDISGRVTFDMTRFAPRFPRGTYAFAGTHAAFLEFAADNLRARGTITDRAVGIAEATGIAYGASLTVSDGEIAIDRPYPFRFVGTAARVDLRALPDSVPVPHVDSRLAFDYDVTGQFTLPFVRGRALFQLSEFLGATVRAGTAGSVDTSARPLQYSGDVDIRDVNLSRMGAELGLQWLQDPRYAGTASGRFTVEGAGAEPASLRLTGGGRLTRAEMFEGSLTDADVAVQIEAGSLVATYDGRFSSVNPAIALNDPRFQASLSGEGRGRVGVRDLLVRSPAIADYQVDTTLSISASTVRGVALESGSLQATLSDSVLTLAQARAAGPALDAHGSGVVQLDGQHSSQFEYDVARADLSLARDVLGREMSGDIATRGRLSGPTGAPRLEGEATVNRLAVTGIKVLATTAAYDVTIPPGALRDISARVTGRASFIDMFDQSLPQAEGTVTYAGGRLNIGLTLTPREGVEGTLAGSMVVRPEQRTLDLANLTVTVQNSGWDLAPSAAPQLIAWDEGGLAVSPLLFVNTASPDQRIALSGTWREDGRGALRITATHVFLDAFAELIERPARYGGLIDLDATLRGTRDQPTLDGQLTITEGRIQRFAYEKLSGRMGYADGFLQVDLRLDQSPGVWLTAVGRAPLALFDRERPEQPIKVAIASSPIGLGLLEGFTDMLREVRGQMLVNMNVVGTSHDPHFTGSLDLTDAGFLITASGARYKNGRAALRFASDRLTVQELHLEDSRGRPLDMKGSLGTHELRAGDLEIDVTARRFEVLDNEFGTVEVDVRLGFRGQFESPRITGAITVTNGELNVNEILDRTLLRPYATEAARAAALDAVPAFNPWQLLGLDIELHVPNTLRLTGDDVQVAPGTPLGFGSFNLRVVGDLYLYKDPRQPLYVTGSLDRVTGTYAFQGRRFDINPTSSIEFRGDLTPELFITVEREISGVNTRVTIAGPLDEPELRLTSTPPLADSDILSLIVFNTSTNQLSADQQRDLAVRAATLAAGFLATPLITALERSLGLDILQIESTGDPGSARVTVGDEIAPGLVARFSRQFGRDEFDEATIEYFLSRILRVRATFSDAGSLSRRSPFRRVERAGIDLVVFFSF